MTESVVPDGDLDGDFEDEFEDELPRAGASSS